MLAPTNHTVRQARRGDRDRKLVGFPHRGTIFGLIGIAVGLFVFSWAVFTHHVNREAHSLYLEGSEHGDDKALTAAGEYFARLLLFQPRILVPLDWAATQSNLAAVSVALGQRQERTALRRGR